MFEDDKPRKKIKRRGDDPGLDALAAELAKESGDPLFVENGKRDEEGAGPGVIVAGGLNEAKAHVYGIRPPAGPSAKGLSVPAEEKRVVVAAEADVVERQQKTLEAITTVVEATQAAAKRGIESARREEAERKTAKRGIEGARKEEAERETAPRAVVTGSMDGRRRAILLGGAALLVVSVLSAGIVGFILGRKGGEELPTPNPSAQVKPLETAISPASASPSAALISEPAPHASPALSVTPTEAPSQPIVAIATATGSGATRKAPASPKPRDPGDDPYGASPAAPKASMPEPKPPAEEAPVAPGSLEFLK